MDRSCCGCHGALCAKNIKVFQNLLFKWIKLEPLRNVNAENINRAFLELFVTRRGTPALLHSDSGAKLNNKALNELAFEFGIHRSLTLLCHSQANHAKRLNRVFKTMIKSFIDQNYRN